MRPTGAVLVLAWAGMVAAGLLLIVHGVQIATGVDTTDHYDGPRSCGAWNPGPPVPPGQHGERATPGSPGRDGESIVGPPGESIVGPPGRPAVDSQGPGPGVCPASRSSDRRSTRS